MPMKEQHLEFIVGYAFADIQKRFFRLRHENEYLEEAELGINIPKCWFKMIMPTSKNTFAPFEYQEYVITHTCDTLSIIFPDWDITCTSEVNNQYQQFNFKFKKKIVRQQLTVRDIEEILGYPIEIVAEKK